MSLYGCKRSFSALRLAQCALLLGALVPVGALAERLPVRAYTTADGLAHDRVRRIYRDSQGFLWFCTAQGLSRFDGYRFVTYTTADGLPHGFITDFLETSPGIYWGATDGGGVFRFDPAAGSLSAARGREAQGAQNANGRARRAARFSIYNVGESAPTNRAQVLFRDRAGRLWVGTDNGLFQIEEAGDGAVAIRRIELNEQRPPNSPAGVRALHEDEEGSLWISVADSLVRRLPDGRAVRYVFQPTLSNIRSLLADRDGTLWVGHNAGLLAFIPEPLSALAADSSLAPRMLAADAECADVSVGDARLPAAPGEVCRYDRRLDTGVRALRRLSNGQLWFARTNGVGMFDGARFRAYTTGHGLSGDAASALLETPDGSIWVGTDTGGALRITRSGFTSYSEADGLAFPWVAGLLEDATGQLCVMDSVATISCFDGERFNTTVLRLPQEVAVASWRQRQNLALQDRLGEWWVGTLAGLYRFPRAPRVAQLASAAPSAHYTTGAGLSSDNIHRVFEDSRGDLWITYLASSAHAVTRWERATGAFHNYGEEHGLAPGNPASAFAEDAAGNVWLGFRGGGLARYAAGRFTLFTASEGAPAGEVRAIYRARGGQLWVATHEHGSARIDEPAAERPRWQSFTTAEGLSSNNTSCFVEDEQGRIYIGTDRGVDRLDLATGRVRRYTTADGLSNNEISSALRDRSGALWFSALNGVSRLIPEADPASAPPSIFIAGLSIAGEPQPVSELGEMEISGLELEASRNRIQIEFLAPGAALRYQYKLEGASEDWSVASEQRMVDFANLAPGAYRFLVRAVSAEGIASQTPAAVSFTILRPLWQRWWFLALVGLMLGATVAAGYRYRVRRLLELERIRTRIATDLHDDIGASLSQIAILSEVVRQRVGNGDGAVADSLSQITGSSNELMGTMSDIVWSIDPRRDHLSDLTHRMRRFASDVFTARGIEFEFSAPGAERDLPLGAELRRQVFLVFKESVNNIVRHSACARASIEFRVARDQLTLIVEDDGCGFDAEAESDGHGLLSIRRRTQEMGGTLEVLSRKGAGTKIILLMPLGRRFPESLRRGTPRLHR